MKIDPNAPAMPAEVVYNNGEIATNQTGNATFLMSGLTIRAELSSRALQALLTNADTAGYYGSEDLASMAIKHADALINALNEEK
mgnify:CR=1 FL=1